MHRIEEEVREEKEIILARERGKMELEMAEKIK
jgi:hypothetical protein